MRYLIVILFILLFPQSVVAQTGTIICYNSSGTGGWTGWDCGPVLPVRIEPIGVEYIRRGETVSFAGVAAGGDYVVIAPAGCIDVSMTAVQRQYATALRNPGSVTIRRNAPYLTCPVEVYRVLPGREFGEPRTPAQLVGEVAGSMGTAASLGEALRGWFTNQLVLWIVAILVGGWLAARVISSIIELVTGGGDDDELIQQEAELYEHLVNEGLDKGLADRIAGAWRDRLSD